MAVKISSISFKKVVRQILEGVQKTYEPCCSECRTALRFMYETNQVHTDSDGLVRITKK